MQNLEGNKIAAAILVAGLIAMVSGKIADALYHPGEDAKTRGYSIEVAESGTSDIQAKVEEVISIAALMQEASVEKGQKLFKKCAACHNVDKGAAHKVGPVLYNMVGRKIAPDNGYAYSDALKSKNDVWGYDQLFAFLKKPKAYAPGTKMSFAGIKKPKDIAHLIAYLRTYSDTPLALPAGE